MLVLTLLTSSPAVFELSMGEAAIGLGALTTVPMLISMLRQGRLISSEPIFVIGLLYFVALTLPYISQLFDLGLYHDSAWHLRTTWSFDLAGLWLYRGWAACCISYWILRNFVLVRADFRHQSQLLLEDRIRVTVGAIGLVAAVLFLVLTGGQAYSHVEGLSIISTLSQIVSDLRVFATIYVFLYFHARGRGRLVKNEQYLMVAVLSALALVFGATSTKFIPMEIGAAWFLGNTTGAARRSLLRELLIASTALILVYCFFYLVTAYRTEIALQPVNPSATFSETVGMQMDAFSRAFSGLIEGRKISSEGASDTAAMLDRLAHVMSLALVFETTHGVPPYEHFWETLLAPVLAFVPRDLVGDKVIFMSSGTFAQLQGWTFGGLSLTTAGSIFWAWGYGGIVLGMMLLGALLSGLYLAGLKDGPAGLIARCLMLRMVLSMLDVGVEFQPIVVGIARMFLMLLALLLVVSHFGTGASRSARRR